MKAELNHTLHIHASEAYIHSLPLLLTSLTDLGRPSGHADGWDINRVACLGHGKSLSQMRIVHIVNPRGHGDLPYLLLYCTIILKVPYPVRILAVHQ